MLKIIAYLSNQADKQSEKKNRESFIKDLGRE